MVWRTESGPVEKVTMESSGPTDLRVTWQPPARPNGYVDYYVIEQRQVEVGECGEEVGAWGGPDELDGQSSRYVLYDLLPYSRYAVRLYAGTVAGRGVPTISTGRTAASGTYD